jgi:hypothetical protein
MTVGPDGSVSAAWRHVYPGNIRDIAFIRSAPGGSSFGSPVRVSEDNWQLNGCPDDGPVMMSDAQGGVHIAWPTLVAGASEERIGIFYAHTADGRAFTPRTELANLGSLKPAHLQMAMQADGTLGVAWDEISDGVRKIVVAQSSSKGSGPATFRQAELVSNPEVTGTYPAIAPLEDGFLVAWTSGVAPDSTIKVARLTRAR